MSYETMSYEVEQKFPVDDFRAIEQALRSLGVEIGRAEEEVDRYFNHPAHDFRESDEALRIRRKGTANRITYKGPRVDQTTKTRREIELPLPDGDDVPRQWQGLLETLGFSPFNEVRKRRRKVQIDWQGRAVVGTLDEVDGLGTFVELELIAEEADLDDARACIASLAERLELHQSERRSYLRLLLDKRR